MTGDISVGGRPLSIGYQRRLGYVQQEDIHMATTTVREALEFSALMRQPKSKTREEKLASVDEVLDLMGMQRYADAVVGVPGEGLNLEQRKRLTIAVEMVARPELLLLVGKFNITIMGCVSTTVPSAFLTRLNHNYDRRTNIWP